MPSTNWRPTPSKKLDWPRGDFWWEDRPWVVIFSQNDKKVVTTYPTDERTVTNRRGGGRWIFLNT